MTVRVLVARLGAEYIALTVDRVSAVLDAPDVRALPLMPSGVVGQLLVRGAWIPVLDPAVVLGIARDGPGPGAALVLRSARGELALWVDDAEEVREVGPRDERPVPVRGERAGSLRALLQLDDRLVAWVEPTALAGVAEGILHTEAIR